MELIGLTLRANLGGYLNVILPLPQNVHDGLIYVVVGVKLRLTKDSAKVLLGEVGVPDESPSHS